MKPIHVACSPLTGTIFAGHILKDGRTWAANKQEVTVEALYAVAEYCLMFSGKAGQAVELTGDGESTIRITVEKLP